MTEVRVQLKDHLIAWGDPQWDRGEAHTELRLPAKDALEHPHSLFAAMVLPADGTGEIPRLSLQIGGPGLSLTLQCGDMDDEGSSCQMSAAQGAQVKVSPALLDRTRPNVIYLVYEEGRYLSLFVNGQLVEFSPALGRMPDAAKGVFVEPANPPYTITELAMGTCVPTFQQRYLLHRLWEQKYDRSFALYPVLQYYNMIIQQQEASVRDPSEILHIDGRYWVYFTRVEEPVRDGFIGSIWFSSCADTADPSRPVNWTEPVEVIPKGDPKTDHDGTGCLTPDCYYDGSHVFVFYTGINSAHHRGFPNWGDMKAPEHIMVARSARPDGGFVKVAKHTPLSPRTRALGYDEATIPGGHETLGGKPAYDVSLIDHGQCWLMDDGERRYYYKGGGGPEGHCGAVCLVRGLDENWLNGHRHSPEPIIRSDKHMEGILITQVQDQLFLQLQIFNDDRLWETWVSDADDGINWRAVGGGHLPKLDERYPSSIGIYPTVNPLWGIGQFPTEGGPIGLAFLRVL